MTLSREQVIAWVKGQVDSCAMVGPQGLHSSHLVVQDDKMHFQAILTLLQSAETVAQERDAASLSSRIRAGSEAAPWVVDAVKKLEAERDRLTQEVERLKEVCPHFWCQSCDAEAQRSDEDGCCLSCGATLVAPKRYLHILKNLVIPSWKAEAQTHQERAEKAEAEVRELQAQRDDEWCRTSPDYTALKTEVTRLRGMWEALKAWEGKQPRFPVIAALKRLIAELEATPSGPAEEGR